MNVAKVAKAALELRSIILRRRTSRTARAALAAQRRRTAQKTFADVNNRTLSRFDT